MKAKDGRPRDVSFDNAPVELRRFLVSEWWPAPEGSPNYLRESDLMHHRDPFGQTWTAHMRWRKARSRWLEEERGVDRSAVREYLDDAAEAVAQAEIKLAYGRDPAS